MLSRGRSCLKRRGVSTVWDSLATCSDEPLFFLYPRWFTSKIRCPYSISHKPPASTRSSGTRNITFKASHRPRKQSFGSTSRRWINSCSAVHTETDGTKEYIRTQDGASTTASDNGSAKDREGVDGVDGDVLTDGKQTTKTASPAEPRRPSFSLFDSIEEELAALTPPVILDNRTSVYKKKGPWSWEDVQVPPDPPIRLAGSYRWSYRDNEAFQQQRLRAREARAEKKALAKWETVQKYLVKLQQVSLTWPKKKVKQELLVPEETIALIVGATAFGERENIFYLPVSHGCQVQVLPSLESEGRCRKVLLSGSDRVVEVVCDRISQARALQESEDPRASIRKPVVPVFPSMMALQRDNITPPLVRGVWDLIAAKKWTPQIHIVERRKKSLTTVREFAEYVEDLVNAKTAEHGEEKKIPHRKKVATALEAVFQVNAYERLISTAALNAALSWLYKYGQLRCVNPILYKAQHVATVDTFNILLKWMARRKDSNAFHHYLTLMLQAKIRPNEDTWVVFLSSVVDPEKRTKMMEWMMQKGYLKQDGSKRKALKMTARESLLTHLENGRSIDSFFNEILEVQGTHWFPPSLTSKMFSILSRRGDIQAMDRLLDICRQQNLEINNESIHQIIKTKALSSNIYLTIQYLYRCGPIARMLRKDLFPWETLFFTAFRGHHYNACRVIWRYACMYKGVTHPMQTAVLLSLAGNKDGPDDNIWDHNAGKVIVGLDLQLPELEIAGKKDVLENTPPEFHPNPVELLASPLKPENPMPFAKTLIRHDIVAGSCYLPKHSLLSMLRTAAKMDHKWQSRPQPTPTAWLMQNAIDVPVKAKDNRPDVAA